MANSKKKRNNKRWVAGVKTDTTHPPRRIVHQECVYHRQNSSLEEGLALRLDSIAGKFLM